MNMSQKLSLENASGLPSFSRYGKGCSNHDIIKELESKQEKDNRIRSKGRSSIT